PTNESANNFPAIDELNSGIQVALFVFFSESRSNNKYLCFVFSCNTPFRCLAAMLSEGSTRAGILPGCPSLDRGSREAEVGFEPQTFRSVDSRSNHLSYLAPLCFVLYTVCKSASISLKISKSINYLGTVTMLMTEDNFTALLTSAGTWPKWLECEFTDQKICGSNPISASRLPLSRLGQPGSIPVLVLPSGGMTVRHRKGATAERGECEVTCPFIPATLPVPTDHANWLEKKSLRDWVQRTFTQTL
ncbi:hypothetical protein CSKR_104003, partial [Clonorchis sinensis]